LEQIAAGSAGRGARYARSAVRLFVAVIPPPALAQRLAEAAASIAPPELRVIPAENLHVTIHFLGDVQPDAVAALEADLAAAAARHTPTELALDAIAPGPRRRPRMLWATAKATSGYTAIVSDAAAAAAPHAPSARPARPGTPHLTLARLRGRAALRRWPDPQPLDDAAVPLAELALVHSTPGRDGATYTELATLPLGGQSAGRR
jgi:2'-5' RNA ligase